MNEDVKTKGEPRTIKPLLPRHEVLARYISNGDSHSQAYRKAWGVEGRSVQAVARAVHKILARNPAILLRVDEIVASATAKTILSLNDRLAILARDAQLPGTSPAMVNARARAISVYADMSGDRAPDRVDVTATIKGDEASPLHVVHRPATKAEKVAALRARRAAQTIPVAAAVPVPQPVSA